MVFTIVVGITGPTSYSQGLLLEVSILDMVMVLGDAIMEAIIEAMATTTMAATTTTTDLAIGNQGKGM